MRKITCLAFGLCTLVPGVHWAYRRVYKYLHPGTVSARYCYGVWLRHLAMVHAGGMATVPKTIAELGPGNSLGIGFAALLSGADRYIALDIAEYDAPSESMRVFDELVDLFSRRAAVPDDREFPELFPRLRAYDFPRALLTEDVLEKALHRERLARLRGQVEAVARGARRTEQLAYLVPWHRRLAAFRESADLVLSQAVLEHVEDVGSTYEHCAALMRPGGFMSHQIDFRSHGTAPDWNGHLSYGTLGWELAQRRMPYPINREPRSTHLRAVQRAGLTVAAEVPLWDDSGLARGQLSEPYRRLSDEDLRCQGTYLLARRDARKPAS